jgi:hypothetical protein
MKLEERAALVWPVLCYAAVHRQTMNYGVAGNLSGMAPSGMGTVLDYVFHYCKAKKLPYLNVIVVSKETGKPGEGYPGISDLHKETERVFAFDWLSTGPPSAADLLATHPR